LSNSFPAADVPFLAVGVDIVEIARIEKTLSRYGERFLHRVYTAGELEYCQGMPSRLAARWAAKEAVAKALGTGMGDVCWREIEVTGDERGAPRIRLHGRASAQAVRIGIRRLALSISHSRQYAVALAVAI
jgi:holo-[acyl-carrier protein] synthase